MQRMLLKKFRPFHSCHPKMKPVRLETTPKTRDDLVYVYEDGKYLLYQVTEIADGMLQCTELNTVAKAFSRHLTLDFGAVGVFENLGRKTTKRSLSVDNVSGKLFCYKPKGGEGLLMTIPLNVLCEI